MKRGVVVTFCSFLLILSITGVLAANNTFTYNGSEILKNYKVGEILQGTVNISFKNQLVNSTFSTNLQNQSISIYDLLKKSAFIEGVDYNCSITKCVSGYNTKTELSKINMIAGRSNVFGFKLTGNSISVNNIKFTLNGNAPPSCFGQIALNVLEDNVTFVQSKNYRNVSCPFVYQGCFNDTLSQGEYSTIPVGLSRFCEKMTLPAAPAYEIGAKVLKGSGNYALLMEFYDIDQTKLGECDLATQTKPITQPVQNVKCVVEYASAKQAEYYVCISSPNYNEQVQAHKIYYEDKENQDVCGFSDFNGLSDNGFVADYNLLVSTLEYDSPTFNLDWNENSEEIIKINEYIFQNYGINEEVANCPQVGCIIPFRIIGNNQSFSIESVEVIYGNSVGENNKKDRLYSLEKDTPAVTSKFLSLDLQTANFSIRDAQKNKLNFYIDNKKLLSEDITLNLIEEFSFDISPKFAPIGLETEFSIKSNEIINSSTWTFENNVKPSNNNKSVYKYTKQGEFNITVNAISNKGESSTRTFKVFVGDANASARKIAEDYDRRISELSRQINTYPEWISKEIGKSVDILTLNSTVNNLKKEIDYGTKDQEYVLVINKLLALDVPFRFESDINGTAPLLVNYENINTEYLEKLSGAEEASNNAQLRDDIITWMQDNYDANVDFENIVVVGENSRKPIYTKFKIRMTPKGEINEDDAPYLFIDYPIDNIRFMQSYSERNIDVATAIPVGSNTEIEFLLSDNVAVEELGGYISPEVERVSTGSEGIEPFKKKSAFGLISLGWVLIIIFTLVLYIVLQEWYKMHYESKLFKNPDELYNLINFIYNSRINGLKDEEIKNKLRGAKWSGEKITYAFKKIDGKRTGMYEIPILKFIERRKVKEELDKRNGLLGGTTFIKR